MKTILLQHVQESASLRHAFFQAELERIVTQGEDMAERLRRGCRILVCGNGGSAADAQHFAAELSGRFVKERRALAGIALTTDTSALTAIGNDYGFERIFSRQVEALGRPGDLLVGISTSGNSPNVLLAVEAAKEQGMATLGLLGRDGGKLGVMIARNSPVAGTAPLTLTLSGLGQPGPRQLEVCVEDAASAGSPGMLKSSQVRTVEVAKDGTATIPLEMAGYSVLLLTLGQ